MTSTVPPPSPDYTPLAGCYDEMLDARGAPRAHWAQLAGALAELGVPELLRRQAEAARLLDQDGVVYNAYREAPAATTSRRRPLDTPPPGPARPAAGVHVEPRVGRDRGRGDRAGRAPEPDPGGRLRPARAPPAA